MDYSTMLDEYRSLLDNVKVAVFRTDATGNWTYLNPAWTETFGYTIEESLGQLFLNYVHPDDRALNMERFKPLIERKKDYCRHEIRYVTKDGRTLWIEVYARLTLSPSGEIIGTTGTLMDLTERFRQQKLIESQRANIIASARLSSLGEMAAGVAHEINNPLAIIQGRAGQLRAAAEAGKFDPDLFKASLEKIELTCQRISMIVRGLKSFSRSGEGDPFEPISLRVIVEDTLEVCRERFRKHGVDLRLTGDLDVLVECRDIQIAQVLLNLLNNAFDAVQGSRDPWIEIGTGVSGELAYLMVTDSGPGVPEEIAKKIMEPFFTTKENGKGTGLGLSISLGIAEDHGGALSLVRGGPNTCFRLVLPLKNPGSRSH